MTRYTGSHPPKHRRPHRRGSPPSIRRYKPLHQANGRHPCHPFCRLSSLPSSTLKKHKTDKFLKKKKKKEKRKRKNKEEGKREKKRKRKECSCVSAVLTVFFPELDTLTMWFTLFPFSFIEATPTPSVVAQPSNFVFEGLSELGLEKKQIY